MINTMFVCLFVCLCVHEWVNAVVWQLLLNGGFEPDKYFFEPDTRDKVRTY